jgi:succinate dehydrogenase / fumarate reductase cytochrome b subunit
MAIKFGTTFLLRKLHQLTGIFPVGLFYFVYLYTNAKAMSGETVYNDAVAEIYHIPFLLLIEIFGIYVPLLYHSVYGFIISVEAKTNVINYGYGRNWLYFFQRVTGVFLFAFILFHLLHFRFGLLRSFGLTGVAVAGNAGQAFQIVAADFKSIGILFFYILGVWATALHLAYGFFLFAVDWGLVIGEKAQKYALYGCAALGIGLFPLARMQYFHLFARAGYCLA